MLFLLVLQQQKEQQYQLAAWGSNFPNIAILVPIIPPITTLGGCAPASGTIPIQISSKEPPIISPVLTSPKIIPTTNPVTIGQRKTKWI